MGTLFSSLDIARSGMILTQFQLDIAAHNIANVNNPFFSRQRVGMVTRNAIQTSFGNIPTGVSVADVERLRDEFLDTVFRREVPGLGSSEVKARFFTLIEDAFLEPGENGFGTRINDFFDTMNAFANNVESLPVRQALIAEAQSFAAGMNDIGNRIDTLRTNANEEVRDLVPEINSLTRQISELNDQIRRAEVNGRGANDLRDQRDALIDDLARIVNISVRETESGQVTVLLGGEVLVDQTGTRELKAVPNAALDPNRTDLLEVRFADTGDLATISDGELFGALDMRDNVLTDVQDRLDTLAAGVIRQINRIHSQGNGLENLEGLILGSNAVNASTDPLISAGLPFPVVPGTFDVIVYDSSGTPTTTTITITATTTLDDLVTDLNAIGDFSASVVGNRLELGADPGFTFSFANDSSEVLTALGVNGLFTGFSARTMGVNQYIVDNPAALTSSFSSDIADTGDNAAALAMAAIRNARVLDGGNSSINDYYEATVAEIGVQGRGNVRQMQTELAFVNDFERRRQEVAGVSIDEEVTNLVTYQRAFEASARVITIADQMLQTLLNVGAQ